MKLGITRTDLVSHTVRADERVRAVAPVTEPVAAQGATEREQHKPALASFRNEELVERYRNASVPPVSGVAATHMAGRAVNAYASVSLVNERDAVTDMLGVSLYA